MRKAAGMSTIRTGAAKLMAPLLLFAVASGCALRLTAGPPIDKVVEVGPARLYISLTEPLPYDLAISLNDHIAVFSAKRPYVSMAIVIQRGGDARLLALHYSWTIQTAIFDHRPTPNGLAYSLSRWDGTQWISTVIWSALGANRPTPFSPLHEGVLDGHETIVPSNDGSYFLYYPTVVGADGYSLIETEVRKYSADGALTWQWRSDRSGAFDPAKARLGGYDYLHTNSITEYDRYLVLSPRDISEVWLVGKDTMKIEHRISKAGGWRFINDPFEGFNFQHHAHIGKDNVLTLYDNGQKGEGEQPVSRAVAYRLDFEKKTATLVFERRAEPPFHRRRFQGSLTRAANADWIIGWGSIGNAECPSTATKMPLLTIIRDDRVVGEVRSDCNWTSYRAWPFDYSTAQ